MNDEHLKKLRDRFPFFAHGPSIGVGDGWFNLLWKLGETIEAAFKVYDDGVETTKRTKQAKVKPSEAFKIVQIKEKFGTLRFYTNGWTDEIGAAITEAERASAVTCEDCGEPGKLRGRTWLFTSCDAHARGEPEVDSDDDGDGTEG